MVPEESEWNVVLWINRVDEWIRIDTHARSVNDDFVNLGKTLQEELYAGPNQNEHLDWPAFDNDSHLKVRFTSCATRLHLRKRKLAVNEGFIQVKHQSFASFKLWHLPWNYCKLRWDWLLPEPTRSGQLLDDFSTEIEFFF